MHNQQVYELEQSIEQHKANIGLLNSLEVLMKNKHFQELILKEYCKEEAVRLVHLMAEPNQQTPEKQALSLKGLNGIGSFNEFLKGIRDRGEISKRSLEADQETLAQVITETD